MRRRFVVVTVAGVAALLVGAVPAAAGGWWSYLHLNGRDFAVGEDVVATSEAFFASVQDAEAAAGTTYFAYLVSDFDRSLLQRAMKNNRPQRWWSVPESATRVKLGRLRMHSMDGNVGGAVSRFTIPKMPPGRYFMMFCDAGCQRPFGHAIPTDALNITADPVAARAARRVDAVEARTQTQLSVLRDQLRAARRETASAQTAVATLRDAQKALELSSSQGDAPRYELPALVWAFVAGMMLAGVLFTGGLLTARHYARRRAEREEEAQWRPPPGMSQREFEGAIR